MLATWPELKGLHHLLCAKTEVQEGLLSPSSTSRAATESCTSVKSPLFVFFVKSKNMSPKRIPSSRLDFSNELIFIVSLCLVKRTVSILVLGRRQRKDSSPLAHTQALHSVSDLSSVLGSLPTETEQLAGVRESSRRATTGSRELLYSFTMTPLGGGGWGGERRRR